MAVGNFKRYENDWTPLFDWLQANPHRAHTVATDSEREAMALRLEFYKARSAATADMGTAGFTEKWGTIRARTIRIDGCYLTFEIAGGLGSRTGKLLKDSLKGVGDASETD